MNVLLAEDHPIYRDGIRRLIEAEDKLTLIYETDNGEDALAKARSMKPEIVVTDINMPGISGLDIAQTRYKEQLSFDIVFLTMYRDPDIFRKAISLGVKGYVLKDSSSVEVCSAILAVGTGQNWYSPSLAEFFQEQQAKNMKLNESNPGFETLTPAELKVLRMIASDRTTKEIAAEFNLSPRTIDNHRTNICRKLNIRGTHRLLKFAFENRYRL